MQTSHKVFFGVGGTILRSCCGEIAVWIFANWIRQRRLPFRLSLGISDFTKREIKNKSTRQIACKQSKGRKWVLGLQRWSLLIQTKVISLWESAWLFWSLMLFRFALPVVALQVCRNLYSSFIYCQVNYVFMCSKPLCLCLTECFTLTRWFKRKTYVTFVCLNCLFMIHEIQRVPTSSMSKLLISVRV